MPKKASELIRIFTSPTDINNAADQALAKSLERTFPIENKHYVLSLNNIKVHKKDFNFGDEKDAILKSKSLVYPIKGDLTLVSKATGKVVDHIKDFPLMDSFHLTNKHTDRKSVV